MSNELDKLKKENKKLKEEKEKLKQKLAAAKPRIKIAKDTMDNTMEACFGWWSNEMKERDYGYKVMSGLRKEIVEEQLDNLDLEAD